MIVNELTGLYRVRQWYRGQWNSLRMDLEKLESKRRPYRGVGVPGDQ